MEEKIKEYVHHKKLAEFYQKSMSDMINVVLNDKKYLALKEGAEAHLNTMHEVEKEIREGAINEFLVSGNKKPWDGIGIRETTKIDYDEKLATEWCKHRLPEALTIEKKKFEKFVGTFDQEDLPAFVSITKVPTATIASDLSEYEE